MQEHFEKVDGINIRYLESNPGTLIDSGSIAGESAAVIFNNDNMVNASDDKRRHVLFIHGLGSSADRWLDIPDALSLCGLRTVAIDLPGFGASDKPEGLNYTIEKFAEVVVKFLRQIGMADNHDYRGAKTSIVGHSLGGYIASYLAIENKDLIDRLVLIDSSGMLKGPTPILKQYLEIAKNPTKGGTRAVFEKMVANPWRIPDTLVDGFIMRISDPNAKHAFESALENSANTQIGIDRLKLIGEYGIPTLVIWGEKDTVIPTKEHYNIFKDAIRNSNGMIIRDTGHAPFSEKPALICELLRRFLVI